MRRKFVFIAAAVVLFSFVAGGWSIVLSDSKARHVNTLLNEKEFIRFHVVANSDSRFDQNVKLAVRDALLDYLTPMLEGADSANGARDVISNNQAAIIKIANRVLTEKGATYTATMDIGIFEFPVKTYGAVIVPAGKYEAVKILLGQASGKNWWCVLFPPLCFIDINSTVAAQPVNAFPRYTETNVNPEKVEFKWKLAELFAKSM